MTIDQMLLIGDAKLLPQDNRYAVTKCGHFYSRRRHARNRYIAGWREKKMFKAGTYRTYLYVHMKPKVIGIHRLVAAAFIGPCPQGQEVRHLDGNSFNNHISNLMYGTHKQNMDDARRHGTIVKGSKQHNSIFTEWGVRTIRVMIASNYSDINIAKKFNCSDGAIYAIKTKRTWAWLDSQESQDRRYSSDSR